MAGFFIDRPIFAWVIAIIIMLSGVLAIRLLPVAQYPSIALPLISIRAEYPGASAETIDTSVTQPIEQHMNGIDNLLYMSSQSDSSGQAQINLTFSAGADPDIAQVQVQNKLQLAMSLLPREVQLQGLRVTKETSSFLMVLGFVSEDGGMNDGDLADYVASNLQDTLARVPGVGQVQLYGAPRAMRIWLDPARLTGYALTVTDVKNALLSQNVQVSAGQLGGTPSVDGQHLNASIKVHERLRTVEQFQDILLRVNQDGSAVRLGDVAGIKPGQETYAFLSRYNRHPSVGMAINLATNANALETAEAVNKTIKTFEPFFPRGFKVVYPYDTTPFVKISIMEVCKTLAEAIILVFLVMFLFLQSFRATLIPTIAVPVVLLGTFGVLAAAGFSINTLTMFGMVLAIGLLVDDAIVVVENVERIMREEGLNPKEATKKSMRQISGALVGIAMVLSAVFIPMAFFGGSTGSIYRQFSITLVSAMTLSVLVALTLTPALCATMFSHNGKAQAAQHGFFGAFNLVFEKSVRGYRRGVSKIIVRKAGPLFLYLCITALAGGLFWVIPKGFLPEEDQGILLVSVQLPSGATQQRTVKVLERIEDYFLNEEKENVESIFTVGGFSFAGNGQNTAAGFVSLKDWDKRKNASQRAQAVAARAMEGLTAIRDADIFVFAPPAVAELGNSSGFDLQLQDRAGLGHEALQAARDAFVAYAYSPEFAPRLRAVRANGQNDTAEFRIIIDEAKASALGVSLSDINDTLQSGWGSEYVNDFVDKGRVKKVYIQAEAQARMLPEDLEKWRVRGASGEMVPFSSFARTEWTFGSPRLERYNGLPATEIVGEPAPGRSSGQAMDAVEEIAERLPLGIGFEWTGISLQERQSGDQAPMLYAVSMLVVFLCLAALYESWSIPFSVVLAVPLGVIGVQLGAWLFGQSNDVYFQVGFLTIIGLSAKNAILIVEFAKNLQAEGKSLLEATREACSIRLRPIIMTSVAFALGVLPLALSGGAGSGSQNAIGIGIVGGMLSTTFLGVFFVPVFYVLIREIFTGGKKGRKA